MDMVVPHSKRIRPACVVLPRLLPPEPPSNPGGPPPGKHSCKCAAAGCRLCALDQVSTSTALSSTGIHGCAQNERSMTPCEKSKSGSEQGAAAQRAAVALEMPPQCRCAAAGLLAVVRDDIDHSLPSTICRMVTRISLAVLAGVGLRRAAPAAIQQDACRRHARGRWHGLLADDASERPWATGLGMVSKRRYRMSIGSMPESGEISSLRHRARPSTRRGALRRSSRSPPQVARSSPAAVVATRSAGPSRAAPYGSPKCSRESPRSSSPGPAKNLVFGFSKLPLGEIRQFEIVEEQVDKFIAAQNEPDASSLSPSPGSVGLPRPSPPERGSTSPSTNFLLPERMPVVPSNGTKGLPPGTDIGVLHQEGSAAGAAGIIVRVRPFPRLHVSAASPQRTGSFAV